MRTKEECKRILFNIGIKFGVSSRIISTRMLTPQDKCDMLNGDLTVEALEIYVKQSIAKGMFIIDTPLSEGIKKGSRSRQTPAQVEEQQPSCHYRKPFVCPEWRNDCHCRLAQTAE